MSSFNTVAEMDGLNFRIGSLDYILTTHYNDDPSPRYNSPIAGSYP
ncbi:MAG: hypothetical protein IKN43_00850 [Selenomonadaceae bacterium]|nr:hypothetical protein [Selenomonadaceae bacterium]